MKPRLASVAQFVGKAAIVAAAAALAYWHSLTPDLTNVLITALAALGVTNAATILARARTVGGSLAAVAAVVPSPPPPPAPPSTTSGPPPVAVGIVASAMLCLVLIAGAVQCSGAMTGESAYAAQNAACVALSTSREQAEACVTRTQAMYCGPEGLLTGPDAGGFCTPPDGGTDGHE